MDPRELETWIVVTDEDKTAASVRVSLSKNETLLVPKFSADESELASFDERPCLRIYPEDALIFGVSAVNVSISTFSLTI